MEEQAGGTGKTAQEQRRDGDLSVNESRFWVYGRMDISVFLWNDPLGKVIAAVHPGGFDGLWMDFEIRRSGGEALRELQACLVNEDF